MSNAYTIIFGFKSYTSDNKFFVKEEDFQIPIGEDSFGVPINELNKIQKILYDGKTIPQLLEYDEFSLWWFIRESIFPRFKKLVNFTTKFIDLVNKTNPEKIEICDLRYFEIIKQICISKQIQLKYSKISLIKFKIKNSIINYIQKYRFKKITKLKIQKRLTAYNKTSNIPDINEGLIFAIPTIYRRLIINLKTGQSEKGEYIQQNIIDLLKKNHSIFGIDLDYTFKGETETLTERMNDNISWFPLELLLDHSMKNQKHDKLLNQYSNLIHDKKFQDLFNFQEIFLWKQLETIFQQMTFEPYLPYYMNLIDSLKKFFEKNRPKSIFLPYETGPYALSFIVTAKKFKIKTIGVAHAVVDKNNPEYSHDQLANEKNKHGFPIPDVTLLFGEFSKKNLLDRGYPPENFVVFGNPAFFNLDNIERNLQNKPLYDKYKIKKHQKIILFGSGMLQQYYTDQGRYDYDSQVWKNLLENFGNDDNYHVILKPHPQENINVYKKILDQYPCKNASIIQGDLYELIFISSVIISIFSTFMLDALVFKKPVIRVSFDNVLHTIPYDEFNVIVSTNLGNLSQHIKEIIYNDEIKDKLSKNRFQFVKYQFNIPEINPELILKKVLE